MTQVPYHKHSELHTHSGVVPFYTVVALLTGFSACSSIEQLEKKVAKLETHEKQIVTTYERRISELENRAGIVYLPTSTNVTAETEVETSPKVQ
ncbi:MAG: hypothetical protein WCI72_02110 [archaeon]